MTMNSSEARRRAGCPRHAKWLRASGRRPCEPRHVAVGGVTFDGAGQFKFALVDGTGATS